MDKKLFYKLCEKFHWGGDELVGIAENIIERIDLEGLTEENLYDTIFEAMDDELIYTADQWGIMKAYQTPSQADFTEAWDLLANDLNNFLYDNVIKG